MGPYMEKVGFYVDRWAIIWTDEPLCGHMGFYLEDGPLGEQAGSLYGPYLERWAIIWTDWTLMWTGWDSIWRAGP